MKKLLCLSLLSGCLFFSACEADTIAKVKFGARVVSKCYEGFSLPKNNAASSETNIKKISLKDIPDIDISLMPAYAWDPKMLVW